MIILEKYKQSNSFQQCLIYIRLSSFRRTNNIGHQKFLMYLIESKNVPKNSYKPNTPTLLIGEKILKSIFYEKFNSYTIINFWGY